MIPWGTTLMIASSWLRATVSSRVRCRTCSSRPARCRHLGSQGVDPLLQHQKGPIPGGLGCAAERSPEVIRSTTRDTACTSLVMPRCTEYTMATEERTKTRMLVMATKTTISSTLRASWDWLIRASRNRFGRGLPRNRAGRRRPARPSLGRRRQRAAPVRRQTSRHRHPAGCRPACRPWSCRWR